MDVPILIYYVYAFYILHNIPSPISPLQENQIYLLYSTDTREQLIYSTTIRCKIQNPTIIMRRLHYHHAIPESRDKFMKLQLISKNLFYIIDKQAGTLTLILVAKSKKPSFW